MREDVRGNQSFLGPANATELAEITPYVSKDRPLLIPSFVVVHGWPSKLETVVLPAAKRRSCRVYESVSGARRCLYTAEPAIEALGCVGRDFMGLEEGSTDTGQI